MSASKPRAIVLTLGCKVNQFESSSISESLAGAGYELAASPFGLDLAVINTCTVTQKADQEALALIRRLKRHNPAVRIVATGCLAQANPALLAESGLADMILGQDEKASLASHLADLGDVPLVRVNAAPIKARDFGAPAPERTRAFYKIQDGCDAFCAYCAVPLSRGAPRSLELDTALEGLRGYLERGVSEVVLCGIHLGRWGRDLAPAWSLPDLLHAIAAEIDPDEELFRLRLSSVEPLEMDGELLAAHELYPWLAPHFHLPLQSGSDRVLELMGRPYRAGDFEDLVGRLSEKWPHAGIGADVMAGFPGESGADFEATVNLLKKLPISYLHVFPYSRRPGTRAADSPHQTPEHVKRARVMELKALGQEKRREFAAKNLGRRELALIENSLQSPSGRQKVLTGNYLTALLPEGFAAPSGALLTIQLAECQNEWSLLEAEPVSI